MLVFLGMGLRNSPGKSEQNLRASLLSVCLVYDALGLPIKFSVLKLNGAYSDVKRDES